MFFGAGENGTTARLGFVYSREEVGKEHLPNSVVSITKQAELENLFLISFAFGNNDIISISVGIHNRRKFKTAPPYSVNHKFELPSHCGVQSEHGMQVITSRGHWDHFNIRFPVIKTAS